MVTGGKKSCVCSIKHLEKLKGEMILNEMQALTVGNLHRSTLAHCLPDHFYHSEPNWVNTSVQGADTWTSRDA